MTLITSPPPTPTRADPAESRMPSTPASVPHLRLERPLEGRDARILTPAAICFLTERPQRF